jgi:hypothetical protein
MAKISSVRKMADQCLAARQPFLLVGHRGVGKSQIIEKMAADSGLEFRLLDLSLAEPVDLLGLPVADGSVTQYRPPGFLPTKGQGILFFDEINRAPRVVLNPVVTLLTSGGIPLSGYRLPSGWRIAAACNPADGDYLVDELDPALRSRFLVINLDADVSEWLVWAREEGLHPLVLEFVSTSVPTFTADANPRAFHYLSRMLKTNPGAESSPEVELLAEGLIGQKMARAFAAFAGGGMRPFSLEEILKDPGNVRQVMAIWKRKKRVDLFKATLENINQSLEDRKVIIHLLGDRAARTAIKILHSALPPDLRAQLVTRFPPTLIKALAA